MRAFVAIDVPDRVLDSLVAYQTELSATGSDLKLVERQNLHITIKFLGEVSEPQAREAGSRLAHLALDGATVGLGGVGAFPSAARPKVVWAGVVPENEGAVVAIAKEVIRALEGIGERDERAFQAHITLARVRSYLNSRELGELLGRSSERQFGTFALTELKLKSSVLTRSGPIYRDLGAFKLG